MKAKFKTHNNVMQQQVPKYLHDQLQSKYNDLQWVVADLRSKISDKEERIMKLQKIIETKNAELEVIQLH